MPVLAFDWTSPFVLGGVAGGVVVLVVALFQKRRHCPKCGFLFPRFRAPASARQAMWGGWTCPKCGATVDSAGQPRSNDSA